MKEYNWFGVNLMRQRKTLGLSQRQFAKGIGMSQTTVRMIEKGQEPHVYTALWLAIQLNTTVESLCAWPEDSFATPREET